MHTPKNFILLPSDFILALSLFCSFVLLSHHTSSFILLTSDLH